ncbi:hypothetical protein OPQ81_002578 [Rhizoctonia solani]|nr:hypothetical protein OPQ81_002578 [Rhizoctonia solani]
MDFDSSQPVVATLRQNLLSVKMDIEEKKKMESDVVSTLDALLSTSGISPTEAAGRLSAICTAYLKTCARLFPGGPNAYENYRLSTPGLPTFFYHLWSRVFQRVLGAPIEEPAHNEYITRLIELVNRVKEIPHPEGEEWLIMNETCSWKDLPLLGMEARDKFNGPWPTVFTFRPYASLLSREGQLAIAGASQPEPHDPSSTAPESPVSYLAKCRGAWLSTQSFISRLWRDCDSDYSSYAISRMCSVLEDWPHPPPSFDAKYSTLEESPAYFALEVEAAAIWIYNTAPLMYECTKIMGPNGNPDWTWNSTPGMGGRRWDGVDGYDAGHKRWQLWKHILGEVIQWCNSAGEDRMQGWKTRSVGHSVEILRLYANLFECHHFPALYMLSSDGRARRHSRCQTSGNVF